INPPLEEKAQGHFVACIKQPPTAISWDDQLKAGGTNPPEPYFPVVEQFSRPSTVVSKGGIQS
nr:hypothetical protein [Gemmatimonadota bacterium]